MTLLSLDPSGFDVRNPVIEEVPRSFNFGAREVSVRCQVFFPGTVYVAVEGVKDGDDIVVAYGDVLTIMPDGRALRAGSFFKWLRQMHYIGARAQASIPICVDDERTLQAAMRDVWSLRFRDRERIELVRSGAIAFSQEYAERTKNDPTVAEVRAHLAKAPGMNNGKGFSPHTACMSLWAAERKIRRREDAYSMVRMITLVLGEYGQVVLRRIYAHLEMTQRVAWAELASQRFWGANADRRKKVPDYLRHWASLQQLVHVRPFGPHLCARNAIDLHEAGDAYEAGDVLPAAERLYRVTRATQANMVGVDLMRLMEAASLDVEVGSPVTTDAITALRSNVYGMIGGLTAMAQPNFSLLPMPANSPEAQEARDRLRGFTDSLDSTVRSVADIVDSPDADVYRRVRGAIQAFEAKM